MNSNCDYLVDKAAIKFLMNNAQELENSGGLLKDLPNLLQIKLYVDFLPGSSLDTVLSYLKEYLHIFNFSNVEVINFITRDIDSINIALTNEILGSFKYGDVIKLLKLFIDVDNGSINKKSDNQKYYNFEVTKMKIILYRDINFINHKFSIPTAIKGSFVVDACERFNPDGLRPFLGIDIGFEHILSKQSNQSKGQYSTLAVLDTGAQNCVLSYTLFNEYYLDDYNTVGKVCSNNVNFYSFILTKVKGLLVPPNLESRKRDLITLLETVEELYIKLGSKYQEAIENLKNYSRHCLEFDIAEMLFMDDMYILYTNMGNLLSYNDLIHEAIGCNISISSGLTGVSTSIKLKIKHMIVGKILYLNDVECSVVIGGEVNILGMELFKDCSLTYNKKDNLVTIQAPLKRVVLSGREDILLLQLDNLSEPQTSLIKKNPAANEIRGF